MTVLLAPFFAAFKEEEKETKFKRQISINVGNGTIISKHSLLVTSVYAAISEIIFYFSIIFKNIFILGKGREASL